MLLIELKNNMELNDIIEGCKNNDRRSYNSLYNIYRLKLLYIIKKYIKDSDTAEEILQESFIKISEKIKLFDNVGSFEGWLKMIVKNKAIDYLRKYNNNYHSELSEDMESSCYPQEEYETNKESELNCLLIKKYLNDLTPKYRTVFDLHIIQEYSHKEIAEMMNINEGTSKSNLFKAKNKIKKLMFS